MYLLYNNVYLFTLFSPRGRLKKEKDGTKVIFCDSYWQYIEYDIDKEATYVLLMRIVNIYGDILTFKCKKVSFNTNIWYLFFDYKITFVNSQIGQKNSKGTNMLFCTETPGLNAGFNS